MKLKAIRVPHNVLEALRETAAALGGVPLELVVQAVVREFGHEEPAFRKWLVEDFWFQPAPAATPPRRRSLGGLIRDLVHALFARLRYRTAE
jgi:hypothetical protein